MKVKNYIVENCYEFIDKLERELCKKGISYVRIDREIHFLDQIIRFYDSKLDQNIIHDMLLNFKKLESSDLYECISLKPKKNNTNKTHYQRQNKKTLKYESNMVNKKIKRLKF